MSKKAGMDVFILLDRTGSMQSLWEEAVGSVNGYVEKLAKDKAKDKITLAVFDQYMAEDGVDFQILRDAVPINDWNEFGKKEVEPRGMTPLYDAFAKIMALAEKADNKKTAIVVMTDGYENASKEHTKETIKALAKKADDKKWQLNFLGANFDTSLQSQAIGVNAGVTMNFFAGHASNAMASTAQTHSLYRVSNDAISYSTQNRTDSGEDKVK